MLADRLTGIVFYMTDYDPDSFDPESIEPTEPLPIAIGETVAAEGETIGECINNFVYKAIPFVRAELNRQKLLNPKKRCHFEINTTLNNESSQRVELQIVCEMFHPILHAEIYLRELDVEEIYLPQLEDTIWAGVNKLIERVEENKAQQIKIVEESNPDQQHLIIAGSRSLFRIMNTAHIMQIVLVTFPELIPSQGSNLLNHFFRSQPPTRPQNN